MTELQNSTTKKKATPTASFSDCGLKNICKTTLATLEIFEPNVFQLEILPKITSGLNYEVTKDNSKGKTTALILMTAHKIINCKDTKKPFILIYGKDKNYIKNFKTHLLALIKDSAFKIITTATDNENLGNSPCILFQTYAHLTPKIAHPIDCIICDDAESEQFNKDNIDTNTSEATQIIILRNNKPQSLETKDTETETLETTTEISAKNAITTTPEQDMHPEEDVDVNKEADKKPTQEEESNKHIAVICETKTKYKLLLGLLKKESPKKALIYVNTSVTSTWLKHKLENNDYSLEIQATKETHSPTRPTPRNKERERPYFKDTPVLQTHALIIKSATNTNSTKNINIHFDILDQMEFRKNIFEKESNPTISTSHYYLICEDYCQFFEKIQKDSEEKIAKANWYDPDLLEVVDKQPVIKKETKVPKSTKIEESKSYQFEQKILKPKEFKQQKNRPSKYSKEKSKYYGSKKPSALKRMIKNIKKLFGN